MQPKDTNKITKDFVTMLNSMAETMCKNLSNLSGDEAQKMGIELKDIQKEADEKIKELKESLSKYNDKINSL